MFIPMFAMVLLTIMVAGYLLFLRISSAKSGLVDPRTFKLNQSKDLPDRLVQASNNFSNLFEVPLFFYLACLLSIVWQYQSQLMILLAWFFVISRVIHSVIHLTRNKIIPRLMAFLSGIICVLTMWIVLFIHTI